MKADLHVHSHRSDGSDTRKAILEKAGEEGVTHIAFTEHDSAEFAKESVEEGKRAGITVIPAIEISAYDYERRKKVHILGYHFKTSRAMAALCGKILSQRNANCEKQIEILRQMGFVIDVKRVRSYAGGGCIYKQHILKYLFDSGQSRELFGFVYQNIFKNGGPCDFDIDYVGAGDAVEAICRDEGYAVLAHPGQQQNFQIVEELVERGLSGIELHHPSHSGADRKKVRELMKRYQLFATGGSDYHGQFQAESVALGSFLSEHNKITQC